jgi:hypothetical protein
MLPGFCDKKAGLLKDDRLFLSCQAGDVILRAHAVLEAS